MAILTPPFASYSELRAKARDLTLLMQLSALVFKNCRLRDTGVTHLEPPNSARALETNMLIATGGHEMINHFPL